MSISVLDAALISQLAYQTPEYVAQAWEKAHGHASVSLSFGGDILGTQMDEIDSEHVRILERVPEAPQFSDDSTTDADCYTFVIKENDASALVLAYRGTSSWQDCMCDAHLHQTVLDDSLFPGAEVHCGFCGQFMALRKHTDSVVTAWHGDVICIGHSLGAIATIAALIYTATNKTRLYTFGSPRIGNTAFASFVESRVKEIHRVVASDDPIYKVPMSFDYTHAGAEQHIGKTDTHPAVPLFTDIQDHDLAKSYIPLLTNPQHIAPCWHEYIIYFAVNKLMQLKKYISFKLFF